jgi:hypothetical protein
VDPKHAYSHRQGESVTRSDRRQREFKLGNPSPPLACLRESNGVVTRKGLAEQGGRYQSEKPFFNLGTVNPSLPFEMSCFANYRICPALLAPRQINRAVKYPQQSMPQPRNRRQKNALNEAPHAQAISAAPPHLNASNAQEITTAGASGPARTRRAGKGQWSFCHFTPRLPKLTSATLTNSSLTNSLSKNKI